MFDITRLNTFLQGILGPSKSQKKSEYLYFCPLCSHHKPKLAINLSLGKWHCWVCQNKGSTLFSLLKKIHANKQQFKQLAEILEIKQYSSETEPDEPEILSLPPEAIPLWIPAKNYIRNNALAYLKTRHIDAHDIIKYRMHYATEGRYANRIIIPSYDANDQLNYFVGRSFFDSSMKYLNPPISKNIIGFENLISWNYPVILCEGVFDAIAIKNNAIPLFGKTIPSKIMIKLIENNIQSLYLALDEDALSDALDITQILMDHDISVFLVHLHGKDPSELGFMKTTQSIKESTSISFDELIKQKIIQL